MQQQVRSVLAAKGRQVASVKPDDTVLAAVEQMNQRRIGAVVVMSAAEDVTRPLGIFTERDVLTRVVARGLAPAQTLVGDVMTRDLHTVSIHNTVMEAMVRMTDRRCRHLPVMDGELLVGLISIGDLTSWVVRDQQRTIDELHDYMHRA
ncbi:MAG: CBS domain-containing protein [Kofleriaceae bacterium]